VVGIKTIIGERRRTTKMTKNIKFIARNKAASELLLPPVPATEYLPDWWKNKGAFIGIKGEEEKKRFFVAAQRMVNHSWKKCTPMTDALTNGYILPLWADVMVQDTVLVNGDRKPRKELFWKVNQFNVFEPHGFDAETVESPDFTAKGVHKYYTLMYIETPPGYSVLITQPFGYRNNPFQVIPAVVDSDTKGMEVLLPMWIKKDFTGVVERGTPMAQITPFKRDDWKMEFSHLADGESTKQEDAVFNLNIVNNYAKRQWKKKSYK
jgi:hypothetical protein